MDRIGGWAGAATAAEQDAQAQPQVPSSNGAASTPPGSAPSTSQPAPASAAAPDATAGISFPATNPPPTAPVVTSNKPGGLRGFIQSIGDALAGKTRPEMGTDEYGNQYVKQVTMTGAQRWARIAAQAAVGAARGFAAGKGGNPGAAAAAGVDAGERFAQQRQQQQKDMTAEARQQNLDRANNQMLTQKIAAQAMEMTRLGTQGTQEAIKFSEGQQDWMAAHAEGGAPIGYAKDLKELAQVMNSTPGFHSDHIQNALYQPVQLYDKDGKADGFAIYKMKAGSNDDMLPAGTTVYHYDAVNDKLTPQQSSQPMKALDVFATNNKAVSDMNAAHLQAADVKARQAATDPNSPENKLKKAQTFEANAAGQKDLEEANKLKNPGVDDPSVMALGEQAAKGGLTEDMISGMSKGTRAAVETYLSQHHPNLDQKSIFMDAGQRKQVNLASNALHNLDTIGQTLQRRPDLLGVINGRLSQGKELTGTNDPDLAAIDTELDNYALASTGAHGIRAVQARADAKKALLNGFKNGPQGVAASIGAARMSLENLASAGKPRGLNGNPYVYDTRQSAPAAGGPPVIAPGTPPPAQGMKRVWAPGMATWKDVPTSAVKPDVPGQVVQ